MQRSWAVWTVWPQHQPFIRLEGRLLPDVNYPEPDRGIRSFVFPPGWIAGFLGDTLERRLARARRRMQRWCDRENARLALVSALKDAQTSD